MNLFKTKGFINGPTGLRLRAWPVHTLLLVAVLAPTIFAIWSIRQAITNERLAVRQRLIDSYESQLHSLRRSFDTSWEERLRRIDTLARSLRAQEAFAKSVEEDLAENVIVHRDSEGNSYPDSRVEPSEAAPVRSGAELRFHALAEKVKADLDAGNGESALTHLFNFSEDEEAMAAVDGEGRYPALNLLLLGIEGTGELSDPHLTHITERLAQTLSDYSSFNLLSSQRLFLMHRLQKLIPDRYAFPTINAEVLATRLHEAGIVDITTNSLVRSPLESVWQITFADNRVTALFSSEYLQGFLQSFTSGHISLQHIDVAWQEPGAPFDLQPFVSVSVGKFLPDWRLILNLKDDRILTSEMEQQVALYTASGAVIITVSILLSLWIAGAIQRNINLARLKDNLVASVSHELKTPVASVRLLVDTLLDKADLEEKQTREYLELISRENMRLSHVVDNFLAFSRMERGKHRFVLEPTDARIIAQDSAQTFRDRFELKPEEFTMEISDKLPEILADSEALKIAVVNLLENAFKYSENPPRIRLGVASEYDALTFSVRDKGIGIPPREQKKIFNRSGFNSPKLASYLQF